ncbi:ankyrin repeat-containing protein BDA1-like [Dioscorea cayenensis subsp. rotundata]|uniref:Ankyrin repeat-containing protein BDA1-like n=1 Tax=Dioscorea cayennensis subsp. rotundata TaxID=55577 RepID=A0AB40B3Z5_DIOCR|nr:ankyrin repeat-containing protein BDA1-like [Dioscorea cayenensis subsp. rotundata]
MILKNKELLSITNSKLEIPLHKAALFGKKHVFWELVYHGRQFVNARREDGSNVLHCAIMGNNAELALEIAQQFSDLIFERNFRAVTPLHLIVTIPQAFRSATQLGFVESLIYAC